MSRPFRVHGSTFSVETAAVNPEHAERSLCVCAVKIFPDRLSGFFIHPLQYGYLFQ